MVEFVPVLWTTPSTSVVEYLNCLSLVISDTENVPLNPKPSVPAVFVLLVTFLTIISSPTFKSWGISLMTVTILDVCVQVPMNLGLRLKSKSAVVRLDNPTSAFFLNPVLLDSCIMKLSSGFFVLGSSFGIATRTL